MQRSRLNVAMRSAGFRADVLMTSCALATLHWDRDRVCRRGPAACVGKAVGGSLAAA
jgi:hypothetical protein